MHAIGLYGEWHYNEFVFELFDFVRSFVHISYVLKGREWHFEMC